MPFRSPIPKFDTEVSSAIAEIVREKLAQGEIFRLRVETPSMAPLIMPGDVVHVSGAKISQVKKGEIVCYKLLGGFGVHRAIASYNRSNKTILTRGEGNFKKDPPISDKQFVGIVTAIEKNQETVELRSASGKLYDWRCWLISSKRRLAALTRKRLAKLVVKSQSTPAIRAIYETLYTLGLNAWVKLLPCKTQVLAVFTYGSMALGRIIPGISDIDLVVIVNPNENDKLLPTLLKIKCFHYRMMRFFPFISPPKVCTVDEFYNWIEFGNFYFQDERRLRLLFGSDPRPAPKYGTKIKRERDFIDLLVSAHGYFVKHAYSIISGSSTKADYSSISKHASDILRYAEQIYMRIEDYPTLPISREELLVWIKEKYPNSKRAEIAGIALRLREPASLDHSARSVMAAELFLSIIEEMVGFIKSSFKIWQILPEPSVRRSSAVVEEIDVSIVEDSVQVFSTNKLQPLLGIYVEPGTSPKELVQLVDAMQLHGKYAAAIPLLVHGDMFRIIKALDTSSYVRMRKDGSISELDFWQCVSAQLMYLETYSWVSGQYPETSNPLLQLSICLLLNLRHALRYEFLDERYYVGYKVRPPHSDPFAKQINNFLSEIADGSQWRANANFCARHYPLARSLWDDIYSEASTRLVHCLGHST